MFYGSAAIAMQAIVQICKENPNDTFHPSELKRRANNLAPQTVRTIMQLCLDESKDPKGQLEKYPGTMYGYRKTPLIQSQYPSGRNVENQDYSVVQGINDGILITTHNAPTIWHNCSVCHVLIDLGVKTSHKNYWRIMREHYKREHPEYN